MLHKLQNKKFWRLHYFQTVRSSRFYFKVWIIFLNLNYNKTISLRLLPEDKYRLNFNFLHCKKKATHTQLNVNLQKQEQGMPFVWVLRYTGHLSDEKFIPIAFFVILLLLLYFAPNMHEFLITKRIIFCLKRNKSFASSVTQKLLLLLHVKEFKICILSNCMGR